MTKTRNALFLKVYKKTVASRSLLLVWFTIQQFDDVKAKKNSRNLSNAVIPKKRSHQNALAGIMANENLISKFCKCCILLCCILLILTVYYCICCILLILRPAIQDLFRAVGML